jgi:hypothetical protein
MNFRSHKISWVSSVFWCIALLSPAALTQSGLPQVSSIEISPAWAGADVTTGAVVTIKNENAVFKRTWDPNKISAKYNSFRIIPSDSDIPKDIQIRGQEHELSHDIVSAHDVMALVRALQAPVIESPSLTNLGITPAWLANHAGDAAKRFGNLGEPNDEEQQEFPRRSFTDLTLIRRIIPDVIDNNWTDDGVWVHVVVRFTDGKTLAADTTNQLAYMLPWTCFLNGKSARTFNASISRAVAQLLPDGSINKGRLQGSGLMDQIVRAMPGEIRQRWEEIGAEDKAGDALIRLRQKYSIRRSEVSAHNDMYVDKTSFDSEVLQADVRLHSFPPNFVVATSFPLEGEKAVGLESFLKNGSRYEQIVLDNPWIMASLRKHPDRGAWLINVKGESMSDKAMRIFAADMRALGRDDLARDVSAHQKEVAVLSYFFNILILFPDHHAIIWRWDTSLNLFEWPSSAIGTARCTGFQTLNQGCSATVVGPNGDIEH